MTSKRRRWMAAAVPALLLAVSACGSVGDSNTTSSGGSAGSNAEITLAGVAGNASDPYWTTLMCGGTKEAEALGVDLIWKAATTASTTEQQINMDAALLLNPDGLIVGSFQAAQFSAKVAQLMQSGTPVVAVNGALTPDSAYQTVLSDSDVSEFAQLVASQVGDSGTIGILGGRPGAPALEARWKPVVEELKKTAPNITVLDTEYDDFDRNKAATIVNGWIIAHPDLKAVYAATGPEGGGAAAAVRQAGKQGQVQVYSYDATPDVVAALKQGTITALFAQSPALQAAKSVEVLVDYLKSRSGDGPVEKASEAQVAIPTKILTKENVDSPEAADYLYKATCDA